MQLNKLIADLKDFKNSEYLVEEFYKEFCNLNNREYDGHFEKLVDFSSTAALKHFEKTLIHTETITFNGFKLRKFNAKVKLVTNEFEKLTELERSNTYQHSILKLKEVLNDYNKDPELKEYFEELNTIIENLTSDNLNFKSTITKNFSFKYKKGHRYDKIRDVFDVLEKEKLIASNTQLRDFELVFQNKPIEKLIQWTGTTSELKYFIIIINNSDYGFENNGDEKWRVAVKCFSKTKKRLLETVDSKNLRTYKVTEATKLKMGSLIVERHFV